MNIEYCPQVWEDQKKYLRYGEKLIAEFGRTGYIDWSDEYLLHGCPETARLFLSQSAVGIYVEPFFRRRGIGHELLAEAIIRAKDVGFKRFLILTATKNAQKFYQVSLDILAKKGEISWDKFKGGVVSDSGLVNYEISFKPRKSYFSFLHLD